MGFCVARVLLVLGLAVGCAARPVAGPPDGAPAGGEAGAEDLGIGGGDAAPSSDALSVAWGTPSLDIGHGGSIPFLFDFAREFPEATLIVSATGGPESMAHAENESLHLGDFENACVAEAVFLGLMASVSLSEMRAE